MAVIPLQLEQLLASWFTHTLPNDWTVSRLAREIWRIAKVACAMPSACRLAGTKIATKGSTGVRRNEHCHCLLNEIIAREESWQRFGPTLSTL
jgi:hypothetical protein